MEKNFRQPLVIAHRGASAIAPENTLTAFRKAISAGADGIEFDVRITKDNVPVVFHDPTLKRVARQSERIFNLTVKELKKAEVGAWFNEKFPRRSTENFHGETIPTLDEFFSVLKGFKGRLYLEMKCGAKEISRLSEAVAEHLKYSELLPQIIVKSFTLEAAQKVKKLLPETRTAALFAPKILTVLRKQKRIIDVAKSYSADELSLHYSLATEKLVRLAETEKMPVTIWTADHPIWIRRALDIGIFAVITNNPERLLKKKEETYENFV